jgi:Na+-transporting methylmalonyl-CoA/oxaloacetate decarboxylase gamma subunit
MLTARTHTTLRLLAIVAIVLAAVVPGRVSSRARQSSSAPVAKATMSVSGEQGARDVQAAVHQDAAAHQDGRTVARR